MEEVCFWVRNRRREGGLIWADRERFGRVRSAVQVLSRGGGQLMRPSTSVVALSVLGLVVARRRLLRRPCRR